GAAGTPDRPPRCRRSSPGRRNAGGLASEHPFGVLAEAAVASLWQALPSERGRGYSAHRRFSFFTFPDGGGLTSGPVGDIGPFRPRFISLVSSYINHDIPIVIE